MTATHDPLTMTTADIARHFCSLGHPVKAWQVRRLYEAGWLPEPAGRMGNYRVIRPADLPAIADALRRAGYLPDPDQERSA